MSTKVYSQKIVDVFTRWRWHRGLERVKVTFVISHGNVILHQTSEFENGLGSQGLHLSRYQQQALSGQFEIPFFFSRETLHQGLFYSRKLSLKYLVVRLSKHIPVKLVSAGISQPRWRMRRRCLCRCLTLTVSVYLSDERRERMMTDVFMFVQLLHKRWSSWHTAIT